MFSLGCELQAEGHDAVDDQSASATSFGQSTSNSIDIC